MTSPPYEIDRLLRDLAVSAAGVGAFDWDLVTGRLVWDDRLLELFGYDRDDFDEHDRGVQRARCTPTTCRG